MDLKPPYTYSLQQLNINLHNKIKYYQFLTNLGASAHADPNIRWISCSDPELTKKCLRVQFENGETDIAELDEAFENDNTNYVGYFKNAIDVRVFASIPHQELGFDIIHVSLTLFYLRGC